MGNKLVDERKYSCVVVDDDNFSIDYLVDYIQRVPDLELEAAYRDPVLALYELKNRPVVDFIFLDVNMPGLSGLELAEELRDKTRFLIFATGESAHALRAYQLKVDQFLLKPFSFATFLSNINFLISKNRPKPDSNDLATNTITNNSLFIRGDQKHSYRQLDPNEIVYIEAAKNYVIICTGSEQIVTYIGLSHMENALESHKFFRISKSFIVATTAIVKVEGHTITLTNGKSLQLGDKYKAEFLVFLQNRLIKKP